MMCKIVYGQYDVSEDGVSHGLCESPMCLKDFLGDMMDEEATCSHSSSSSTRSGELSFARKNMDSSLPSS